ncbi:PREDICTED: condensin-2 complex subunit D3 [Hipposideros armiger]|uniref:Condensin-2 complex subunit D3 n=1 Tax=Hipposideros armiger TaxID=186990 RepID=A0A8B7QMM8_HIPAR|nr:PREDICTED: condensin-2 complex subunit D3 [Hipposideros armiger]
MVALPGLGSGLQPWCPLDLSSGEETRPRVLERQGFYGLAKLHLMSFFFLFLSFLQRQSIWTFFAENNISHSALVALFYHFVQTVHKKNVSVQHREYGLHAAGLYFLLLEIPGSVANQVFHPVMFDKCIQILKKSWPQESNLSRKRKKEQPKNSQADSRGHRKRGKPPRKDDIEMDEIIEEQEDEENICFSAWDLCQIRNAIFHLLKNFLRLLSKFSLKEKPQCVQNCIEVFVALTNFEPVPREFHVTQARNLNRAKYIPELAYYGLYLLCSPIHGEGDKVLVSILKHCNVSGMKEELSILQDQCRDPAVSVRKQALQSLTELLMAQPRCVQIQKAWLMGIIPVVMDGESTVQEKALECLDQLLLQNIKHYNKFHSGDDQRNPNSSTLGHILCVIGHIAKHLPKSTRDKVTDVVKCKLNGFQWSLELISSAVDTLQRLCRAAAETPVEEQVKYIFTLGDIAQLCPASVEKRAFLLIQSILASSADADHLTSCQGSSEAPASQPVPQVAGYVMPSAIRAHAIITLGNFGEFCLAHLLLKRNPVMFFQHFIECIFHFNNYEKHEKYNKFPQSEREKRLFSLKGKTNKEKRMKIYKFLLEHFTDDQRFNMTSKICLSILACFADGILPLDMEASELLSDTFEVLSSKEIKLLAMRSKPDKDLLMEEDDMALANVVMQEAQKKLLSQVQKRNFIENIIPIIISLKTVLEKNKIPALRELMNYLREVMQDYRDEIKDFFAVDKQLASELEYDMKKYNEQLAQEQELAKQADVNREAAGAAQVAPSLEILPAPAGQENASVPHAASQPSISMSSTNQAPPLPLSLETGPLKRLIPKARSMSLSTIAILNSVKKAVESNSRSRNRSIGVLPFTLNSESLGKTHNHASSYSLEQESSGAIDHVTKRAVSTPEKTISDVTFEAGVSYIGTPRTPLAVKEKVEPQSQGNDILCLSLPDKPPPQPQQWNVKSPARNKDNPAPSRRSLRKAPLKTAN